MAVLTVTVKDERLQEMEEFAADYIISGDKDLLVLNGYNGIGIITAKEYLDIVTPYQRQRQSQRQSQSQNQNIF